MPSAEYEPVAYNSLTAPRFAHSRGKENKGSFSKDQQISKFSLNDIMLGNTTRDYEHVESYIMYPVAENLSDDQ